MVNYSPGPAGGPLLPYMSGFRELLDGHGYAMSTSLQLMALAQRLDHWLQHKGLDVSSLDNRELQLFLDSLRAEATWLHPTAATFTLFMEYLRGIGAIPMSLPSTEPPSPEELLFERFRHYLSVERGLGTKSVRNYERSACSFMAWLNESSKTLKSIDASDVITFAIGIHPAGETHAAKGVLTGLRAFLRWAYLENLTSQAWVGAVPSAAGHGDSLPQGLTPKEVDALLATCDRGTVAGLRNYAILVLMSRLGLRACEVSALLLRDMDWRSGEILIRGKGSCQEKLPLPYDVGSALADYLHDGRRPGWGDSVFLKLHAPVAGLAPGGVSDVVLVASQRAGIPGVHAHRLRHTAGTQLLQAGASLAEVGQVLRHRSPANTALYAKVDDASLRELALPWPGTAR